MKYWSQWACARLGDSVPSPLQPPLLTPLVLVTLWGRTSIAHIWTWNPWCYFAVVAWDNMINLSPHTSTCLTITSLPCSHCVKYTGPIGLGLISWDFITAEERAFQGGNQCVTPSYPSILYTWILLLSKEVVTSSGAKIRCMEIPLPEQLIARHAIGVDTLSCVIEIYSLLQWIPIYE